MGIIAFLSRIFEVTVSICVCGLEVLDEMYVRAKHRIIALIVLLMHIFVIM